MYEDIWKIGRWWIWRLLLPAELVSGLVGFPRGRKLEALLGFLDLLVHLSVWEQQIYWCKCRNSDAHTNSLQLSSPFPSSCQNCCCYFPWFLVVLLHSMLAHTSPPVKQGRVVLSHCKVIRRWAKQQGSSAGSHVWLVSTGLLWL